MGIPVQETESIGAVRAIEVITPIPSILSSPDRVSLSPRTDTRRRTSLLFEKRIGENDGTIQAVSDGTQSIQTDTLYKQKMTERPTDTESNAGTNASPAHNVQNVPPSGLSAKDSIPQSAAGNNRNPAQTSMGIPVQEPQSTGAAEAVQSIPDALERIPSPGVD